MDVESVCNLFVCSGARFNSHVVAYGHCLHLIHKNLKNATCARETESQNKFG